METYVTIWNHCDKLTNVKYIILSLPFTDDEITRMADVVDASVASSQSIEDATVVLPRSLHHRAPGQQMTQPVVTLKRDWDNKSPLFGITTIRPFANGKRFWFLQCNNARSVPIPNIHLVDTIIYFRLIIYNIYFP